MNEKQQEKTGPEALLETWMKMSTEFGGANGPNVARCIQNLRDVKHIKKGRKEPFARIMGVHPGDVAGVVFGHEQTRG